MKEVEHDQMWHEENWGTDEPMFALGEPGEEPVEPAFEDQNFMPALFVTLSRIYDLLAVLAINANPPAAAAVLDMHEKGKLKGSPPYLVLDEAAVVVHEEPSE